MNKDYPSGWDEPATSLAPAAPKTGAALPLKQIVTIRLDVDMLEWFKSGGPGYQTRINQILRDHMAEQRRAEQQMDEQQVDEQRVRQAQR